MISFHTPWGTTRIWEDLPKESQAILWGITDELHAVHLYAHLINTDFHWHESWWCGLRVFRVDPAKCIATIYHYGQHLTVFTQFKDECPQYAEPSATYDLNDPGSIPSLVRFLKGLK
jgi:hypothetical protein